MNETRTTDELARCPMLPRPTIRYRNPSLQQLSAPANTMPTPSSDSPRPNSPIQRVVTWNRIPEWLQDNEHIQTGYRIPSYSYLNSFASWSYLHNQTVNIYSHLFGAILLIVACVWLYRQTIASRQYATADGNDVIAFAFFFVAGMCCLCFSTTFHTLSNHSPEVRSRWVHLDILGIVALTIGTFVPGLYYCFYCEPVLQMAYWFMIISLGVAAACVLHFPQFRHHQWRRFRAIIFVSLGLSSLIPIIHAVIRFGLEQTHRQSGLYWYLLEGLLYALGAIVYATRIPECWRPGTFDIWGSSHQIFHTFVLLGLAAHLAGLLVGFHYNHTHPRC